MSLNKLFLVLFLLISTLAQAGVPQSGNTLNLCGTANSPGINIPASNPQGFFGLYAYVTTGGQYQAFFKSGVQYQVPPYVFTVTSANATVGATYTNGGNTYTVMNTIAAATTLYLGLSNNLTNGVAAAASAASGTLTKASGTGDSTITYSAFVPGKTTHIVCKVWQSGTGTDDQQYFHTFTAFSTNASSITAGLFEFGVVGATAYRNQTSSAVYWALPYEFPSGSYPGSKMSAANAFTAAVAYESAN